VLWEVLAGQSLYRHEYAATTLHKLLHETPPRLSTVVPEIDADLEALVARALAARPEDRFQSAHEMRDALDAWLEAHDEVVSQEDVGALVQDLFKPVRQAVQRQIQAYMAGIGAVAPADGSDTGRRPSGSGPIKWSTQEGQLPSIEEHGEIGSGSAVVRPRKEESENAESRRGSILWLLAATLAGSLVAAGVVVARVVHRGQQPSPAAQAEAPAGGPGTAVPMAPGPASSTPETEPRAGSPAESLSAESSSASLPRELASGASAPPHPSTITAHPVRPGTPETSTATAAAADPGFLSFDTYPWTRVSEAGRIIGDTPLVHVSLSPGPHVLTLDNPEHDIHKTYSVTIKPGESVSRRLGLD
jgi:serine/threonine-protein kinase